MASPPPSPPSDEDGPPAMPIPRSISTPAPPKIPRSGVGLLAGNRNFPGVPGQATRIPPGLQAKMAAMTIQNRTAAAAAAANGPSPGAGAGAGRLGMPGMPNRPALGMSQTTGRRPKPGLKLSDIPGAGGGASAAGLGAGRPTAGSGAPFTPGSRRTPQQSGTPFANFQKIVDPSGRLNFGGKAILHAQGVDFSNGSSFSINMGEFRLDEELGKGNYGTVKKVWHKPTNVAMAMKEIRLELDDAKLNAILMELDILHRATAPEIVEFYGAFFIESCVYYCMEYMDAGSLDKLEGAGVPEHVLARIAGAMVRGLKFLKDDMQIIHRDVKPTNVLVSRKGTVKLCDFGVSGQLEKSLAKTNIGCQSYMAPERIQGESQGSLGTYTVSSDVWSLGLSLIELATGKYPYPPETYSNVFAQLTAIVHEPPPELPEGYSEDAVDFVGSCMRKDPVARATYAQLLEHPLLVADLTREVDMEGWVAAAIVHRDLASRAAAERDAPPPKTAPATLPSELADGILS